MDCNSWMEHLRLAHRKELIHENTQQHSPKASSEVCTQCDRPRFSHGCRPVQSVIRPKWTADDRPAGRLESQACDLLESRLRHPSGAKRFACNMAEEHERTAVPPAPTQTPGCGTPPRHRGPGPHE